MASYLEEFFKTYQRPTMGRVTVGFSGIDPVPKASESSNGLDKPPDDGNLYAIMNGTWVRVSVPKELQITLTEQHISDKCFELPDKCEVSKPVIVVFQGLLMERGSDWEVITKDPPEKDLIAWNGLELESIVQAGDKVYCYYFN